MTPVRIAMIGVGPRGLSAMELVVSRSRLDGPPVDLVLVEPGDLGADIHHPEKPDYLLLNTICSKLTIFSDRAMAPGAPVTGGTAGSVLEASASMTSSRAGCSAGTCSGRRVASSTRRRRG